MRALWEYITAHQAQLAFDSYQHVSAVVQSVLIATVIGVLIGGGDVPQPVGCQPGDLDVQRDPDGAGVRPARFAHPAVRFGGVVPSVTALVLYSLLPIVRNTIVGLTAVDPALTDAARGIGDEPARHPGPRRAAAGVAVDPVRDADQHADVDGRAGDRRLCQRPGGLGNLIFTGLARVGSPTAVPMALAGTC